MKYEIHSGRSFEISAATLIAKGVGDWTEKADELGLSRDEAYGIQRTTDKITMDFYKAGYCVIMPRDVKIPRRRK